MQSAASEHTDHRLLPESFMVIRQAAGVPGGRERARAWVEAVIEDAKRSGFVREALVDSDQGDVTIAP
jgi:polar amino acid transport system substrate-binding protein